MDSLTSNNALQNNSSEYQVVCLEYIQNINKLPMYLLPIYNICFQGFSTIFKEME